MLRPCGIGGGGIGTADTWDKPIDVVTAVPLGAMGAEFEARVELGSERGCERLVGI